MLAALIALSLLVVVPPARALAQEGTTQQILDQRYIELSAWLEAYRHWEAWTLKWGNKIAYNAAGGVIKDRPIRPEPPAWLRSDCRALIAAEGKLGEACAVLAHWGDLEYLLLTRSHVAAPMKDAVEKTSFLQRVHISGGWVPAQLPAPSVYLVAGMQVGIVELGRVTLPAVGAGLIAMSDGTGGYEWRPATVIGIGYRLTSFAFPGIRRQANLHFNVARVTIHGTSNIPVGLDLSQNLLGFSLTFNKAR